MWAQDCDGWQDLQVDAVRKKIYKEGFKKDKDLKQIGDKKVWKGGDFRLFFSIGNVNDFFLNK